MTCVRLEPVEMTSSASVLHGAARELIDIGAEVQRQCCGCSTPSTAEGQILAVAAAVEAALVATAGDLRAEATDLAIRADVAANDSLAAAAMAPLTVGFIGGGDSLLTGSSTLGVIGGGYSPLASNSMTGVIGGSANLGMTIIVSGTDLGATLAGGSFVGGRNTRGMELDAIAAQFGPGAFLPPTFAQDAATYRTDIFNNPSRGELINGTGTYMSPTEYLARGHRGLNQ